MSNEGAVVFSVFTNQRETLECPVVGRTHRFDLVAEFSTPDHHFAEEIDEIVVLENDDDPAIFSGNVFIDSEALDLKIDGEIGPSGTAAEYDELRRVRKLAADINDSPRQFRRGE